MSINKINISSLRVLQLLMLLYNNSYTMQELVDAMKKETNEPCTNFLVSKYINTCRFCGIDIQKLDGKYTLLTIPFGISLSDGDLKVLQDIDTFCRNVPVNRTIRHLNSILGKINQRSDKYFSKIKFEDDDKVAELFEQCLDTGYKIELVYNDAGVEKTCCCEPLELGIEDSLPIFIVSIDGERTRFFRNDVVSIKKMDVKAAKKLETNAVVFKLKNALAKRYTLRPDEKIVNTDFDGTITVLNKTEDKETLLSRLMKYGELCEIESPKNYRKEMLDRISKTLANYQ